MYVCVYIYIYIDMHAAHIRTHIIYMYIITINHIIMTDYYFYYFSIIIGIMGLLAFRGTWAATFVPIPPPDKVLQTSYTVPFCCLDKFLQAGLGMGMGNENGTAQDLLLEQVELPGLLRGLQSCIKVRAIGGRAKC